ncbi:MAG: NUDIX domain-containing protein [Shimia sp.]
MDGTGRAPFHGAKLALFLGPDLLVIQRDDIPGIAFPGHWDLPGGGREADESPVETALRETREEVALDVPPAAIAWCRPYWTAATGRVWFLAAHLPADAARDVVLGDEGQGWALWAPARYLGHPLAVPNLAWRLGVYLWARPPSNRPQGGGRLAG